MAVKRTGQMSLVEAFIGGRVLGSSGVLDRIGGLVKWYRFEKLLSGFNQPQGMGQQPGGMGGMDPMALMQLLGGMMGKK